MQGSGFRARAGHKGREEVMVSHLRMGIHRVQCSEWRKEIGLIMTKVHHRIKSIGREFTFEEWGRWCDEKRRNGTLNPVVYEFDGFQFNDHDVCLNPIVVHVCESAWLRIARFAENKWCIGLSYNTHQRSYSSPCAFDGWLQAPSKDSAILTGLHRLRDNLYEDIAWFGSNDNYRADKRMAKQMLSQIEEEINKRQITQLSLF